ncbi:hypothetical protein EDD29_0059 [Actinocorallia herbida]|uniref:Uncharacterized protein n=1 Tax=Actinocorallia herbida TaxID=58109 RepID=A0A3N1CMN6_9ACTN|nr:hypothetical protein [Actinocorallia herbida]ROO82579.1 hypothetical protein EDD29_0059 [Actinocorallia herbida]
MADYLPESISHAGIAATSRSAAAGDKLVDPGDGRFLRVNNASVSSITLTITPPGTTGYGVANPAKVFTIAAGATRYLKVLRAYGDPSDAYKVALAWSATASVTFDYLRA